MNALLKISRLLESILFLGRIQAGLPVAESPRLDRLDDFDMESLRIPKNMRTFALKLRGESMINAGIHDGDVVILDFEREVKNRDIVAALMMETPRSNATWFIAANPSSKLKTRSSLPSFQPKNWSFKG